MTRRRPWPAGDIISRAIERARLQDEAGVELQYQSLVATTIDSLNGDGEVTKTETDPAQTVSG